MKFNFVLLLALSGLLIGLLGQAVWSQSQESGSIERSLVLSEQDGTCVVTASPTRIQGARRNFIIRWRVINECSRAVTPGVGNFKHVDADNQAKLPLDLETFRPVAPNSRGRIQGRVKDLPEEDWGLYKYDILIDGEVAEDPELEIEGPRG
ncbi:MAG TPA: hypothetical protein VLV83_25785 [Acidobacteriota bacterium]|nr:hypothetical protein [Acidobacteriota bacterium]